MKILNKRFGTGSLNQERVLECLDFLAKKEPDLLINNSAFMTSANIKNPKFTSKLESKLKVFSCNE